jgi:hypothetical protein
MLTQRHKSREDIFNAPYACFPDENQIVGSGKTAPPVGWLAPGVKGQCIAAMHA